MRTRSRSTLVLAGAVGLNYVAQIPYYLHQYYLPHHVEPAPLGTLLLAATLLWFVIGYQRYVTGKRFGYGILLGFLLVQVTFYGHSVALGLLMGGGAVAQLTTRSHFLFVIFAIGYLNFVVAAYYVYWLLRDGRTLNTA